MTPSPMNCQQWLDLLESFLDDELSSEIRHEFEQHTHGCSCCGHYLESYRLTIRLTRQLKREALPSSIAQRMREKFLQAIDREFHSREKEA